MKLYKAGDTGAFDELMKKTEALRSSLAQRYLNIPGSEFEDLMSEGAMEMLYQGFAKQNYTMLDKCLLGGIVSWVKNEDLTLL